MLSPKSRYTESYWNIHLLVSSVWKLAATFCHIHTSTPCARPHSAAAEVFWLWASKVWRLVGSLRLSGYVCQCICSLCPDHALSHSPLTLCPCIFLLIFSPSVLISCCLHLFSFSLPPPFPPILPFSSLSFSEQLSISPSLSTSFLNSWH